MRKDHRHIRVKRFSSAVSLMGWVSMFLLVFLQSIVEANTAKAVEVPKDEIRRAIVQYFERNVPWKTAEVRIREVRIPGSVFLSTPQYDLSIRVPPNTRFLGHTPVQIVFNEGKTGRKRIWASVYLEVLHPVAVIKRPMAKNQIISPNDIGLEKRDLAKIPPGAITDVDEVVGKRLKRTLAVGAVIRRSMVDRPPVVKRGDVVNLLIETPRLKITALGRVEERGGVGDVVRVINLDSKRKVYGQVVNRQLVRIRY